MKAKREPRPPKLPAVVGMSETERAALAFAKRMIAQYRDGTNPWSSDSPLSGEASRAMVRYIFRLAANDLVVRMRLLAAARAGDRDAHAVLWRLSAELQSRGQLTTELEAYDLEIKTLGLPGQSPGPKRKMRILRDLLIADTAAAVVDKFGLHPTKRSPTRHSACKIVAMALASAGIFMGHKSVEKIVYRYANSLPTVPGWASAL